MVCIYFIRHGESVDNKQEIIPKDNSALSIQGEKDIICVAKNLQKIFTNLIISSDQICALQTANILAKKLKLKIKKDPCLRERKFPQEIVGKREDNVSVKKILHTMHFHAQNEYWHYSNEENFIEFRNRAKKFLYDRIYPLNENIIIVSHAGFIRMIMCLIKYGDRISWFDYDQIRNKTKIKSGSIIQITLSNRKILKIK